MPRTTLGVFKARMDVVLVEPVEWEATLFVVEGLEPEGL